jgi:AcrR family transcriptional regulator
MAGTTTRQRYLDAVVEHMAAAGRTDLTLVILAEAAGTSDRMLVYYFKTREALLNEVMATIRSRRRRDVAATLASIDPDDIEAGITQVLGGLCAPEAASRTRLFQEAAGRAMREESSFVEFIEGCIADAVAEAEVAARRLGAADIEAQTFGTLFTALSTSLPGDALATGPSERIDRAVLAAARALTSVMALG